MLTMTVKGVEELRSLSRDLRRAKGPFRADLTKAFKRSGERTLKKVKHNMTSMQIRGYSTGRKPRFTAQQPGTRIRQRIARVTELDISTGTGDPRIRFLVRTGKLGAARNLPWHLDTGRKFRHPIMGNRSSWAASAGKPWFYQPIRDDLDQLRTEVDGAIDRTVARLERG